jgi:hypothetical protein
MNNRGEATIMMSVVGALAAGSPLVAGVVLTSDNVAGVTTFVVALIVGLISIGTGVGKVYAKLKANVAASIRRDELLDEIVRRMDRIEVRQIEIQKRLDQPH